MDSFLSGNLIFGTLKYKINPPGFETSRPIAFFVPNKMIGQLLFVICGSAHLATIAVGVAIFLQKRLKFCLKIWHILLETDWHWNAIILILAWMVVCHISQINGQYMDILCYGMYGIECCLTMVLYAFHLQRGKNPFNRNKKVWISHPAAKCVC